MPRQRRNRPAAGKQVESLRHEADTRTNIPTAEYQALVQADTEAPRRVAYQRRNRGLRRVIDSSFGRDERQKV